MNALPTCCKEWLYANESGTDNEGYGVLIDQNEDGDFRMGAGLHTIRFCPWCGADKTAQNPLVTVAQQVVDAFYEHGEWDTLKNAIGNLAGVLDSLKKDGTK